MRREIAVFSLVCRAQVGVTALALLFAATSSAFGQAKPQTREGFWIGFGFGYGSLGCEDCDERSSSAAVFLKMGGTLNSQWLLGGEIEGWSKDEGGATLTFATIGPVVQFYPSRTSGFFLKGGVGLATVELDVGNFISGGESGAAVMLGAGFDGRVGKNFSLTPYLNVSNGSFDGGSVNLFTFGLGFTWH